MRALIHTITYICNIDLHLHMTTQKIELIS